MIYPALCCLFFSTPLFSYAVGNFADPEMYRESASPLRRGNIELRTGYLFDYLYKLPMREEFVTKDSDDTDLAMNTYAAIITMNLCQRLDLYTILGSSKMQEEEIGFIPRRFSWSLGAKAVLLQWGCCCFSVDSKYLATKQKPSYYVLEEGQPAFVLSNLDFTYQEFQIALGFGYRFSSFTTYWGATYTDAKLEPNTNFILLEIPAFGEGAIYADDNLKSNVNQYRFGVVWGFSLLACGKMSLNVESRHLDQNAVNVSSIIQF